MTVAIFKRPGTDDFRFTGDPRHIVARIVAPFNSWFCDLQRTRGATHRDLLGLSRSPRPLYLFAEQAFVAAMAGDHGLRLAAEKGAKAS